MLNKFQITEVELAQVREVGRLLENSLEQIVADFYAWLEPREEYRIFFGGNTKLLDRVMASQVANWRTFFTCKLDETYFASRRHIGAVHAHINLPNDIYYAGMCVSLQSILRHLRTLKTQPPEREKLESAVIKLVFFDTYLVAEEISRIQKEKLNVSNKAMHALSTPVLPVWDGVLLLPLMGVIDSARSQEIMNKVLTKISENGAHIFVLDISGVSIVDTAVANQLIRVAKATGLMGCQSIISGISPSIARTLVELGTELGSIKTTATLRNALDLALKEIGVARARPMNITPLAH